MAYLSKGEIVIVGLHGKNLASYLKDFLLQKGIKSSVAGITNLKNINTSRKITNASTIICLHSDIESAVSETYSLEEKHVICLEVDEMPQSGSSKPLTGEAWVAYQEEVARPTLRKQVQKHLKVLV